jgi:hypothetical protein
MRSQDQTSDTKKQGTAAVRGARARRGGPAKAPAIAANHAVASRSPQAVLALQRAAGNAAVAQLAEQEQHVHDGGCGHQRPVQRSGVDQVLRSPGTPIAAPVRQDMEARLGADFSDVRLHDDASARRSAAELGARAFTSGSHVVLGAGGGDSQTLAHELIHVVQQRQGPVAGTDNGGGLKVSDPSDRFEREAEAGAARAMSAPAQVRSEAGTAAAGATAVQRAPVEGAATAVQRAPGTTTLPPEVQALMQGAARHEMGGNSGFVKYRVDSPNPGGDPEPLYRAMSQAEFDGLRSGGLPQGSSFQGFTVNRSYSETNYITGSAKSHTHLVEFYRRVPKDSDGLPVPDINTALKRAGAPTKAEDDDYLSTGVGLTAPYSGEVPGNTVKNKKRADGIAKATGDLRKAEADVDKAQSERIKGLKKKHVANAQKSLDEHQAKAIAYPAVGDALKALNEGLARGVYGWRLVTLKTTG